MSRKFGSWAYLNEEGMRVYGEVFPKTSVPVLSMIPQSARLGDQKPEKIYLIYGNELEKEQVEKLLDILCEKFGDENRTNIFNDIMRNDFPLRVSMTSGSGTNNLGLFL